MKRSIQRAESSLHHHHNELEKEVASSAMTLVSQHINTIAKLDASHDLLLRIDQASHSHTKALSSILRSLEQSDAQRELNRKTEILIAQHSIPQYIEKAPLVLEDIRHRRYAIDLEFVPNCR